MRLRDLTMTALFTLGLAGSALAQPPAAAPPAPPAAWTVIPLEITVNAPIAQVWDRVGGFCDIGTWARFACTIVQGKDGEIGAIRSNNEIMVGGSQYSYSYIMLPRPNAARNNFFHGTLEARAIDANTTKVFYTLIQDDSGVAEDAKRAGIARLTTMFTNSLNNIKIVGEGGTLPPRPPAAPAAAAPPAAR